MGRDDLEQDKHELAEFLRNMYFTEEQLADLMVAVEESDQDVEQVTMVWMNENKDLVESWILEGADEMTGTTY